jgi:2-oxoglutarate ferredoxin oxidoreductase subunit gamma
MAQTDLTIAGVGGQGSILAGVILGSAAVIFDGKYATQTQAYSSELRGGFAAAWIIVADEPIEFPRVTAPDILVAQAQDSINRFGEVLKPDGILIADSDMVQEIPPKVKHLYKIPATTIARNEIKSAVAANMIILSDGKPSSRRLLHRFPRARSRSIWKHLASELKGSWRHKTHSADLNRRIINSIFYIILVC